LCAFKILPYKYERTGGMMFYNPFLLPFEGDSVNIGAIVGGILGGMAVVVIAAVVLIVIGIVIWRKKTKCKCIDCELKVK